MTDALAAKLESQPPPMTPTQIADHVWNEARNIYTATLNKPPGQEDQPTYIRHLMTLDEKGRGNSWEHGLSNLPMPNLRTLEFAQMLPILEGIYEKGKSI